MANEAGSSARLKAAEERWKKQVDSYKEELPEQKKKAEELDKKSQEAEKESVLVHHKADRFDMGELAVELALILSSIAVLTKRKAYWIGGIVFAIIGTAIAATGFFA